MFDNLIHAKEKIRKKRIIYSKECKPERPPPPESEGAPQGDLRG